MLVCIFFSFSYRTSNTIKPTFLHMKQLFSAVFILIVVFGCDNPHDFQSKYYMIPQIIENDTMPLYVVYVDEKEWEQSNLLLNYQLIDKTQNLELN